MVDKYQFINKLQVILVNKVLFMLLVRITSKSPPQTAKKPPYATKLKN